MASGHTADERRVFNPRPRRHHRRRYSLTEVRLGGVVLVGLAAVAAWVAWRGAHPDPELFADPARFLDPGAPVADRGPLPRDLIADGWRESGLARFDASNLYEKIDGRADYFLGQGFVQLTAVTLTDSGDPARTVDVELYDMGSPAGARGALAGEKAPDVEADSAGGGLAYVSRNALFVARGRYYVRAIGSDEGPRVQAQLERLRAALEAGLAAGERPWSLALFADGLGVAPDAVGFQRENAFSFAFARNVHTALLADGETEAFAVACADAAAARALAEMFRDGFAEYGESAGAPGEGWVRDRYLGTWARAVQVDAFVVGIRSAPDAASAAAAFERLDQALGALPEASRAQARAEVAQRPAAEAAPVAADPYGET